MKNHYTRNQLHKYGFTDEMIDEYLGDPITISNLNGTENATKTVWYCDDIEDTIFQCLKYATFGKEEPKEEHFPYTECNGQTTFYKSETEAEDAVTLMCLEGNDVTLYVWCIALEDYIDWEYAALNKEKIIENIGFENYNLLLEDVANYGYCWFDNIQCDDEATINESMFHGRKEYETKP